MTKRKITYHWRWRFEWKLEDLWIGVFWKTDRTQTFDIWICILPCLPLHGTRWFQIHPDSNHYNSPTP